MHVAIAGNIGAGKTTLARKLMKEFDDVVLSVSATTREPRPNETDGVDYHFRSESDFRQMIAGREFLEWAKVFDRYYGTPRADTVAQLVNSLDTNIMPSRGSYPVAAINKGRQLLEQALALFDRACVDDPGCRDALRGRTRALRALGRSRQLTRGEYSL